MRGLGGHSISSASTIAVFAKAPVAGEAKTRLIPVLGAPGAARLHLALVRQSLETALNADIGQVELWCTQPDASLLELAQALRLDVRQQCEGGLGHRMAHAFAALLAHAGSVILVGTDCPAREVDDFRTARAQLASGSDAVLGPTEDGGYQLIGLRSAHPSLFENIDWSTERVLQQTRDRMRDLDLTWHELPVRWDVDRPEDLARLRKDAQWSHRLIDAQ